jgi:hypothetical protein
MAKRSAGNPWMTAAFVFIVLFIISAILAVVLYLNYEKSTTTIEDLQQQQTELVNNRQWSSRGSLIGTPPARGQTYIGTLLDYINHTTTTILGAPSEETSAEVKVDTVDRNVTDFMSTLQNSYPDVAAVDVNTVGLLGTMQRMKNKLDNTAQTVNSLEQQLKESQEIRDQTIAVSEQKVQELTAARDALAQQAQKVQSSYDELKALMETSTDQQVKTLYGDLQSERERSAGLNQDLLKTQAELEVATEMLRDAREQLSKFVGKPDAEPQIRQADGKILLVDEYGKVVHINLGKNQKVYPGLTFGVYEQNVPIPSDGKGKAEIEVINVADNMSTARITRSNPMNTILENDQVANLVWSQDKPNLFVVAGDFDLDGNGTADPDAARKIRALIENWGGQVQDTVTVNTTFIVLGDTPAVLPRPTYDQIAIDPLAMDKYETSLKRLESYQQTLKQAQQLDIPILNYDRFLYLIGYKSQSSRPGAFAD